jgi:hypothetical protein
VPLFRANYWRENLLEKFPLFLQSWMRGFGELSRSHLLCPWF